METFRELRQRHAKETSELPIVYAFGHKQFVKAMESLGLKENQTHMVCTLFGAGDIILVKDAPKVKAVFCRHTSEFQSAMRNEDFAYEAFDYELANHEYCYTGDASDALHALDLDYDAISQSTVLARALKRAIKDNERNHKRRNAVLDKIG